MKSKTNFEQNFQELAPQELIQVNGGSGILDSLKGVVKGTGWFLVFATAFEMLDNFDETKEYMTMGFEAGYGK